MKKTLLSFVFLAFVMTFSVNAAEQISRQEANTLKLQHIGDVNVSASGGKFSSPSDLYQEMSKLADEKGGKYYVVITESEHGSNFDGIAEVYK